MSQRFPVKVNGVWREVEISFASEGEVKRLAYWRIPRILPDDIALAKKIYDAAEFARLACNRWRYYHQQHSTVESPEELNRGVEQHRALEVAMVMVAHAAWSSPTPILGLAYLRRTWCNHLFLEFFATHPRVIIRRPEQIGGIGDALLHCIVMLAEQFGIPCISGEATENSHSWYQDHLAIKEVRDHFFIEDDVMLHCQKEMRKAQKEMLARRTAS